MRVWSGFFFDERRPFEYLKAVSCAAPGRRALSSAGAVSFDSVGRNGKERMLRAFDLMLQLNSCSLFPQGYTRPESAQSSHLRGDFGNSQFC